MAPRQAHERCAISRPLEAIRTRAITRGDGARGKDCGPGDRWCRSTRAGLHGRHGDVGRDLVAWLAEPVLTTLTLPRHRTVHGWSACGGEGLGEGGVDGEGVVEAGLGDRAGDGPVARDHAQLHASLAAEPVVGDQDAQPD